MSFQFSIIIICKNEAENIERALASASSLSDDIVAFDNGSTDDTVAILKKYPTAIYYGSWEGFGKTRQKAVDLSKYKWVLIIDADEVVSPELFRELEQIHLTGTDIAYRIRLKNHIGKKQIRWGSWGHDKRVRLYNKDLIRWNEFIIHEKPVIPPGTRIIDLKSPILHYTAKNMDDLSRKWKHYAAITAKQYYLHGKRSTWLKRNFSGFYAFIKSYFIKLGFLDGRSGFKVASIIADYTNRKYRCLHKTEFLNHKGTKGHEENSSSSS